MNRCGYSRQEPVTGQPHVDFAHEPPKLLVGSHQDPKESYSGYRETATCHADSQLATVQPRSRTCLQPLMTPKSVTIRLECLLRPLVQLLQGLIPLH